MSAGDAGSHKFILSDYTRRGWRTQQGSGRRRSMFVVFAAAAAFAVFVLKFINAFETLHKLIGDAAKFLFVLDGFKEFLFVFNDDL